VNPENLQTIVFKNTLYILNNNDPKKNKVAQMVLEALERAVLITGFAFSRGNKKKVSTIAGIGYGTVKCRIRKYKIIYLGTKPNNESYLSILRHTYSYDESPIKVIEYEILKSAFLYCLNNSNPKDIYQMLLPHVEIGLISAGFRVRYSQVQVAMILGMDDGTLRKKINFYNIRV
jgi:DNA-binding protein Fis